MAPVFGPLSSQTRQVYISDKSGSQTLINVNLRQIVYLNDKIDIRTRQLTLHFENKKKQIGPVRCKSEPIGTIFAANMIDNDSRTW